MDKLKVVFTGDCEDFAVHMSNEKLDLLLKHKPPMFLQDTNFAVTGYVYDPEADEFRIALISAEG